MVKFMLPTKSQKLFDLLEAGELISRSEQQKNSQQFGGPPGTHKRKLVLEEFNGCSTRT